MALEIDPHRPEAAVSCLLRDRGADPARVSYHQLKMIKTNLFTL